MSCNYPCQLCNNVVISDSVTFTAGTNTLTINIPEGTYYRGCKYCIVVAQTIPADTTINATVNITIGTSTTTYPLVKCDCTPVSACALRTRTKYPVRVVTDATSGSFKILCNLPCTADTSLASLPVAAAPAAATVSTLAVARAAKTNAVKQEVAK